MARKRNTGGPEPGTGTEVAVPEPGPGPAPAVAVAPEEGGLAGGFRRSEWVDPRTLGPNPENVRDHPPEQVQAVRESIRRNGWTKPLIVNQRTGRLIDGHCRLAIALADGTPAVPVNFGDWTEDQERELLAFLDASGAAARIDPVRFERLRQKLTAMPSPPDGALGRLAQAMATDPFFRRGAGNPEPHRGQAPVPDRPLDLDAEAEPGPEPGPDDAEAEPDAAGDAPAPPAPPTSHVRMVQLFLDAETLPVFERRIDALQDRFGTETTTDTVMEALRQLAEPAADAATAD